jgi:hypothetical protein
MRRSSPLGGFARPAVLGDLGADPDAGTRCAVRRVDVADVEADELGESETAAAGQTVDQVVAGMCGGRGEDRFEFTLVRVGGLRWGMGQGVARWERKSRKDAMTETS